MNVTTKEVFTLANSVKLSTRASEHGGDLQSWLKSIAGTNDDTVERLKRHLPEAIREELTPRQQQILQLHYFEHLKGSEISEKLGVNRSTVSRALARAENRLKRVLKYCL